MKDLWKRFVAWIRRMAHLYGDEIKETANDLLDLAFANLDEKRKEKLNPAIRKKIANKVLADILILGIDVTTAKGKAKVCEIIMDAIDWFAKDGE